MLEFHAKISVLIDPAKKKQDPNVIKKIEEFNNTYVNIAKITEIKPKINSSNFSGIRYELEPVALSLSAGLKQPAVPSFKLPERKELEKKTVYTLDEIAQITTSVELKNKIKKLAEELREIEQRQKEEINKIESDLKKEKDRYSERAAKLRESFKDIQQCYEKAAADLKKESSTYFAVLEERYKNLQKEIEQKEKSLQKKLNNYSEAAKFFSEKMPDQCCHEYINLFKELKTYCNEMIANPVKWDKTFTNIKKEFASTAMEYGLLKKDEKNEDKTEKDIQSFRGLLAVVKARVDQDQKVVDEREDALAQREILNLINDAIIKNLSFWSEQVDSFWGSCSTINGVQVPDGIKKMYEILQNSNENFPVEKKLINIYRIAEEKQKSGLGMFAKRQGTTGDFYNTISTLFCCNHRKYRLNKKKSDIILNLEKIKDKKNRQLLLSNVSKNIGADSVLASQKTSSSNRV